jgi:hypothetical protein
MGSAGAVRGYGPQRPEFSGVITLIWQAGAAAFILMISVLLMRRLN